MLKKQNALDLTRLLLQAYIKVLRVNLTDDTFDEIKVDNEEIDAAHGYSTKISEWLKQFALSGNVHEIDLERYLSFASLSKIQKEFSSGKEELSLRYRRRNHSGYRWAKMTLRKSDDYSEENQIVMLYIEDIHDDVLAANELEEQHGITNALVDMYFLCLLVDMNDNSYHRVYVDNELNSYVKERGNMQDVMDVFQNKLIIPHDKDDFEANFSVEIIREMLKVKKSFDYEYLADIEHGEIYCRIGAILVDQNEDGSPKHVLIVMRDVTSQAKSTAQKNELLKEAFTSAVAANSAKSDFMSRMSHDIRTPLNGIIGMTAIAGAHIDEKEKVADCLTKITGASKHLLSLINDILDLSKIESGKLSLNEEEFNLPSLMDSVLTLVHPMVEEHQHELNVYVHNVKHEEVVGDPVRLQQVFHNLISNAIKYTQDKGKINITLSELPSTSANIGVYEFICEDNGIGMSKEFQEKLFEPFERAEDSRVNKIQGTGLGMTITQNIVNRMGGSIHVESKEGDGSKFIVDFKMKYQADFLEPDDSLMNLPVLVVDDDSIICESTCITLEELGMKADYSLSGKDAVLKVVKAHDNSMDYYACLIDWKMPEMDGIETTRQIRKAVGPDVPIIIISAYDWEDIEEEARNAGADAFISKPLFKSRLHATFKDLPKSRHNSEIKEELEAYQKEDFSKDRILIVEDNDLNREIITEMVKMTGAQVDIAEDGSIALKKVQDSSPNYYQMVLMDIRMPVMDGYESTKAIRALSRKDTQCLPIIALTANAFMEDITLAKEAGMNEHLAKPIDPEKLLEVMEKYLQ